MAEASGTSPPPQQQHGGLGKLISFMSENKVEAALWLTRMFTIVTSVMFMIPLFGGNPMSLYQKALLSSAATSALRLHQRLPNFQLSREFLGQMFLEDSAHYLFFSLIFIMSYPVTMALVPVFLFALLHAQNYTKSLLNQIGPEAVGWLRNLLNKLATNQQQMLRFIACSEIFMMPIIILMIFSGHGSFLLPFVYYRFLTLRYASRRNPYCRTLFYELRVTTEHLCSHQSCPAFVRNISYKMINFISRLAPPTVQQ